MVVGWRGDTVSKSSCYSCLSFHLYSSILLSPVLFPVPPSPPLPFSLIRTHVFQLSSAYDHWSSVFNFQLIFFVYMSPFFTYRTFAPHPHTHEPTTSAKEWLYFSIPNLQSATCWKIPESNPGPYIQFLCPKVQIEIMLERVFTVPATIIQQIGICCYGAPG